MYYMMLGRKVLIFTNYTISVTFLKILTKSFLSSVEGRRLSLSDAAFTLLRDSFFEYCFLFPDRIPEVIPGRTPLNLKSVLNLPSLFFGWKNIKLKISLTNFTQICKGYFL